MMNIDEILKTIREELNISQETLALDLNVSFSTINRWENSRTKPSRLAVTQIKKYCVNKGISANVISALEQV